MALQHRWQRWRDRLALQRGAGPAMRQFGAIPYTVLEGRTVFLIITSRRTGRWIFPKGGAIEGLEPPEIAAYEAREEAGVEGDVEAAPIGAYHDTKTVGIRRALIEVELYPLRVTRQLEDWPEKGERHRHWVILPEAKRLLANARLGELAALLDRRATVQAQPATAPISQ